MSSKQANFWAVPFMFAAALTVSACSSDPMMEHDSMGQGMESQMMDDMKGVDGMDKGMDDSMNNPMGDSMDSKM